MLFVLLLGNKEYNSIQTFRTCNHSYKILWILDILICSWCTICNISSICRYVIRLLTNKYFTHFIYGFFRYYQKAVRKCIWSVEKFQCWNSRYQRKTVVWCEQLLPKSFEFVRIILNQIFQNCVLNYEFFISTTTPYLTNSTDSNAQYLRMIWQLRSNLIKLDILSFIEIYLSVILTLKLHNEIKVRIKINLQNLSKNLSCVNWYSIVFMLKLLPHSYNKFIENKL